MKLELLPLQTNSSKDGHTQQLEKQSLQQQLKLHKLLISMRSGLQILQILTSHTQ